MVKIFHFGDITKINGHKVPLVDIITGGSPCQDISIAGNCKGLAGERSGLFFEQIRIVKEMREESERQLRDSGANYSGRDIKCRFLIWENVFNAFSTGNPKGADFQAVLQEICKIVCKDCPPIPIPKEGWHYAGSIDGVGDDGTPFSISWRTHDAQYWGKTIRDSDTGDVIALGTPQRRRRISVVADFGGLSAPSLQFECESECRNIEESKGERERVAGTAQDDIGETGKGALSFQERAGKNGG